MTFRLQYASNLCIPFLKHSIVSFPFPVAAPSLALLGNIGTPECPMTRDFFQWADESYQQIFWIPGGLEYSSTNHKGCAWNERADACYNAIRDWKLERTSFCQKMSIRIPHSKLTVLASPGGIVCQSGMNHFIWNHQGNYEDVVQSDYERFRKNEHAWMETSLIQTPGPIAILSHGGISLSLLKQHNVIANLYGINKNNFIESSTGGNPWTAINMMGRGVFRPMAVFEYADQSTQLK